MLCLSTVLHDVIVVGLSRLVNIFFIQVFRGKRVDKWLVHSAK